MNNLEIFNKDYIFNIEYLDNNENKIQLDTELKFKTKIVKINNTETIDNQNINKDLSLNHLSITTNTLRNDVNLISNDICILEYIDEENKYYLLKYLGFYNQNII